MACDLIEAAHRIATVENGNGRRTVADLGLRREAEPGAERLLRELIKRGLPEDHFITAAGLAIELDRGPQA